MTKRYMLLLQMASTSLFVVSLLAVNSPQLVEARLAGQNESFLAYDPNAPSSKGNEFVLGFMGNSRVAPVDSARVALFVTTDDPDPVEFTVEYFGRTDTFEARRGRTTLTDLPVSANMAEDIRIRTEGERNKGVRVKATDSTKLLTVYGINDARVSTDAFLALPCHRYPVVQYKYFVFSTFTELSTGTFQSRFLIVPCEDDTRVTLQPTQQIQADPDLTGQTVPQPIPAGGQLTITMDRLQTAQFNSADDLTGSIIISDKPISVFVGHECGQVPGDVTACDHLVEQIPPDATWGTQFFTAPLDVRESGEHYRVGTVSDNNQVTVTCTLEGQTTPRLQMTRILRSQRGRNYLEFDSIGDNTNGVTPSYRRDFCCIETTKPAIVMMYSKGHSVDEIILQGINGTQGDPFMLLVPPVSQYSNDYTVTTAKQVRTDFIGYISFTIPIQFFDNSTCFHKALTVNETTFLPDSGYYPIVCSNNQTCGYGAYSGLPVGDHQLSYKVPRAAMSLFVYGFLREISFAYPAGFEMQAIGVPRISIFNVTVLESVGTVQIPINRTGGDLSLESIIRASSRDVPGQAIAFQDYMPLSNFRIRWRTNEVDPRFVTSPSANDPALEFVIIDNHIPEQTEYFEIDLIPNPGGNGNGFFFPSAVGRVTIIDDDSLPLQVNITGRRTIHESDTLILELNCTSSSHINVVPLQVNITGRRTIHEFMTLELNCTSSRSATLSWFKRENTTSSSSLTKIVETSRISITFQDVDVGERSLVAYSVLAISDVTVSDNGIYVCVAQDGETRSAIHTVNITAVNECQTVPAVCQNSGQYTDLERGYSCTCTDQYTGTNCTMEVIITQPTKPEIIESPSSTIADVVTPINLTCMATGNPPPTYQWFKDGYLIPGETRSYLYIADRSPERRGNYTCRASNSQGNASEQANIDIRGILQYTACVNFTSQVADVGELLLMIINSNISTSSVYAVEVLNSSQNQMFTLLITLNVSSSAERSATLKIIESSLINALANLPTAMPPAIQRYDGCNPESPDGRMWPETTPGSTASIPCPCMEAEGQLAARVTRPCEGTYSKGASWGTVDDSQCRVRLSGALCMLFENNLTAIKTAPIANQIDVSQVIEIFTSTPEELTAGDVSISASIISQLTTGAAMNATLRDSYLQIIDNIQQADVEEVLASQTETDSSQMILQSLQQFQDAILTMPSNTSDLDNETVFTFRTFAIKIQELDTSDEFEGQSFSVNLGSVEDSMNISGPIPPNNLVSSDNAVDVSTRLTASIQLPNDLFMSCGLSGTQRRLSYSVFLSDVLFQNETQRRDGLRVGSIILAPRLLCNRTLNTPITVSFRTNRMIEANASDRFCGSWNTEGSGAWLLSNCEDFTKAASDSENEQGGGGYTAKYRQLAHFGILFDVSPRPPPPEAEIALSVITYVGLVTSLLSLMIFLISYFGTKKLRTSIHGQILINMSLALMGLYIFFLISGHVTSLYVLCGISAALLQYFFLAFFGWTVVEVVWLYLKLVKVFGVQSFTSQFMLKAGIPTWALPLLIVIVTAAPGHKHYYTPPYCRAKEWPFYAGTIVPFILVYIVNWIMFIFIMASICKHTKGADHKKGNKVNTIRKNVVIALTLATIFGLGWGIGLAATSGPIAELSLTFQIVFSILVGLQGTLIFVLHGVRNKDVRNFWKQCFGRIGGKLIPSSIFSSTKSSSAGPQSLRGTTATSGTMSLGQKKPLDDHMYDSLAGEGNKSDNGHMQYTTLESKRESEHMYTSIAGEETKCDLGL